MRLGFFGAAIALLVAGCGAAPVATVPSAPQARSALRAVAERAEVTATLPYRSPRTPFHSDKFDLDRGRFTPIDDGMGPRGDLHFFYDGAAFYAIANQAGGEVRQLALVTAREAPRGASGPVRLAVGDRLQLRHGNERFELVITGLDAGTMRLSPTEGAGQGAVTFAWEPSRG